MAFFIFLRIVLRRAATACWPDAQGTRDLPLAVTAYERQRDVELARGKGAHERLAQFDFAVVLFFPRQVSLPALRAAALCRRRVRGADAPRRPLCIRADDFEEKREPLGVGAFGDEDEQRETALLHEVVVLPRRVPGSVSRRPLQAACRHGQPPVWGRCPGRGTGRGDK